MWDAVTVSPDAVPVHIDEAPTARVLPFANRFAAGTALGQALASYSGTDAVVLGIPHSGVPVAHGVAHQLQLALDVWVVRKLKPTTVPPVVLGVIAEGASLVLDRYGLARSGMTHDDVRTFVKASAEQVAHDARCYRRGVPATNLAGKTVILVDDGIPTGRTLSAAIDGARKRGASKVVVAAPVGAEAAVANLEGEADAVVCLMMPPKLRRVGAWYADYRAVSDGAVMKILAMTR